MAYDRVDAVNYAHKWAYTRNPRFYNFEDIGGDCTNFISQCIYAGCHVMNYRPELGWYYNSPKSRSAAWSGVQFLYNFIISNKGDGPYGHEAELKDARPGDVIQLSFDGVKFTHSLFVVSTGNTPVIGNSTDVEANSKPGSILVATHSFDADNRPLNTYTYNKHRLISIDGARL